MGLISEKQVEQRRQARTTHGANSYLARTAPDGRGEVTETMALVESQVLARHDDEGPRGMVETGALRFEVAAELLWQHMQTSPEAFDAGLARWGWLQGAAIRAWRDHAALSAGPEQPVSANKVLESLSGHPDAS